MQGEIRLSEEILQACKELVDDAKKGCADLVFKEVSLEILSKASQILSEKQFKNLLTYTSNRMKDKVPFELHHELLARK